MKREHAAWVTAGVLALLLVCKDGLPTLPTVASVTPWWLRPRLLDGSRVQALREAVRGSLVRRVREAVRGSLVRRVRERVRSRLAWTASLRRGTPTPAPIAKPERADCPECRGTGRVRTGDGISWTECDRCVPPPREEPEREPEPEPEPERQAPPAPVVERFPAASLPPAPPGQAGIPQPVPTTPSAPPASGPMYRQECGPNGCRWVRIR